MVRTSLSHPIRIAELAVGTQGGAIGITFAPGKFQEAALTGSWARDIDTDLAAIREWGADYLITLIEPWEFEELRIQSLPARAVAYGLIWHGLPIVDGAAPDTHLLDQWGTLGPLLSRELLAGRKIVVHCKGGLGRAGTIASMLLLDTGEAQDGDGAIGMVRRVRPGAIETSVQEVFIRRWGPASKNHRK
ncbi:cyclin-dependent kinase inhibitor 3 family protein [Stenotrophomonas sp.]|uniref:cyclin-dependent kinase inhibitor 3 family protein n=1 Tax=Stenotrophomonas sp. TaxID=69392 RepID=UPI0028A9DD7A|nr:cyclin-dependent kinase inhibitor 3 family protein [Stenotrophomonas sp.]